MFITLTYIKLRSVWKLFPLTFNAMKIVNQLKGENGFVKMKSTGFGLNHYTMSSWKTEEDRQRFYRSGAHGAAMKKSANIASEIRTLNYTAEELTTHLGNRKKEGDERRENPSFQGLELINCIISPASLCSGLSFRQA